MDEQLKLSLGGVDRVLRFTFGGMRKFESVVGKSISDALKGWNCDLVATLIWAGLQHEYDAPSQGQVDSWLDAKDFNFLGEASKAIFAALNGEAQEKNG